jgi:hypothetical protein
MREFRSEGLQAAEQKPSMPELIGKQIGDLEETLTAIEKHAERYFGAHPVSGSALKSVGPSGLISEWSGRLDGIGQQARDILSVMGSAG